MINLLFIVKNNYNINLSLFNNKKYNLFINKYNNMLIHKFPNFTVIDIERTDITSILSNKKTKRIQMRQLLKAFFTARIYFFLPPKPILFRGRFYIFRRAGTFVL